MAFSSPIPLPSSFDPAIHLHSEPQNDAGASYVESHTYTDDLEALHIQHLETTRENYQKGIFIQRSWYLSDVFRSDDDIQPDTPTRACGVSHLTKAHALPGSNISAPSTPGISKMAFVSSPAAFPPSSPPMVIHKRKLGDSSLLVDPKRKKTIGGFIVDDDSEEDDQAALPDMQFLTEFALVEQTGEQPNKGVPVSLPFPRPGCQILSDIGNARVPAPSASQDLPQLRDSFCIKTCSGSVHNIQMKTSSSPMSCEKLIASRSSIIPGKAQRTYYGIEIHRLLDEAAEAIKQNSTLRATCDTRLHASIEKPVADRAKAASLMWTEKYRAQKFTDLLGDERTHRSVLHWLKAWDPIVFPGLAKPKRQNQSSEVDEPQHRKILLLAGSPGLGKTTLAHVCAKQAGYEVLEINASDERSKDVVKGRIRETVCTENVKSLNIDAGGKKTRNTGRPICVVIDEADGTVGGEGGFIKALIDLVLLDQKHSTRGDNKGPTIGRKKKSENFRLLRPLILICNDIYHTSLRPLRASALAEIVHVRHASLDSVIQRLKIVLEKEGILFDSGGVRRLCEASWGLGGRTETRSLGRGVGDGDIRSVLVAAEWAARKLKAENFSSSPPRLTKGWLEQNILHDSLQESSSSRGPGRGVREIIERVFMDGAGFPDAPAGGDSFQDPVSGENPLKPIGVADIRKRRAITRLREMVDTSGEYDRCVAECFTTYPTQTYQDDTFLSKPNAAHDWLHFHDSISSRIYAHQDWELNPYLSQSIIAFHHLFASASQNSLDKEKSDLENEEEHPFSGPKADFTAYEAQKQNRSILLGFQSSISAPLLRIFSSPDCVITDLIPNLVRILSPNVKPVVIKGNGDQNNVASVRKDTERVLIQSAVRVMYGLGVTFERVRVEHDGGAHGGWVYRMEPPLDVLTTFSKRKGSSLDCASAAPVRYAVRQVLDQEYRKETTRKMTEASQSKYAKSGGKPNEKGMDDKGSGNGDFIKPPQGIQGVKRDFFGRIIDEAVPVAAKKTRESQKRLEMQRINRTVWVTFHEGFSNAVRKPISMSELLADL